MIARAATPQDDLRALWPELTGCRVNYEQVLVVVDEAGGLLAGALLFHGGHEIAYVGSTVIVAPSRRAWVAHALLEFVKTWCAERGVTWIGHGAGTEECKAAFAKLGAKATRQHTLMEMRL